MSIIDSSERRQSRLRSFGDLIRLSSSERRQLGSPSAVAYVSVQIEISRLSSMSFVYLSKCHPVTLFLLLHRMWQPLNPDTGFLQACS